MSNTHTQREIDARKHTRLCVCVTGFPPSVKQVFKDMEFLGWYTTGGAPDQSDIHIHKQVGGAEDKLLPSVCCVVLKQCVFFL